MLIKGHATTARELASESHAIVFALRAQHTLSGTVWIVIMTRMFAHNAFQVLRSKHWYVIKHFARALFAIFGASAVDFPGIDIVEKVILVSTAAEAFTRGTNGFAI